MLKKGVVLLMAFFAIELSGSFVFRTAAPAPELPASGQWIGAWSASQIAPRAEEMPQHGFSDQTIRMIVRPAAAGSYVRLRFSNAFGKAPVTFNQVTIAAAAEGGRIDPAFLRTLTFSGETKVTIAPGSERFSDPVPFPAKTNSSIAVSVFVSANSGPATWHPVSSQTTYIASGNRTESASFPFFALTEPSWFWLSGLDVLSGADVAPRVIAVLGDSITDGYLSALNQNRRWTDALNKRFHQSFPGETVSVLNHGISGNRLLRDSPVFGVHALSRLETEVFSQTGVTDVILLAGINDIGQAPHVYDAGKITDAIEQAAKKAHARGLRFYAGTLTPFRAFRPGDYFTEEGEQTRQQVNNWIRRTTAIDGFIDFDKALQDPAHPDQLLPAFNSGDHLHPNDAGLKAMADAVDLSLFRR